jgi:hypothetical protein
MRNPKAWLPWDGERFCEIGEAGLSLLVQDNAKKRAIHLQPAVVLDEAQLPEFVHEEIHS